MTSRRSVHSTASAPWKESSRSHAADSTIDDEVTQQSDVDVLSKSTRSWTRTGRGGVQEYTSIIHISSIIVACRPVNVRLALWFLHHPAWAGGATRVGPWRNPRPCREEPSSGDNALHTNVQRGGERVVLGNTEPRAANTWVSTWTGKQLTASP